jgi:hypothetical protein
MKTANERKTYQRQRDADAIQRWIDAGCPPPPAIYRTMWSDKRRDAPTVMFWIRSEFGKDGEG